ncbi:MAG: 30S ribosomal protein S4 [Thermoguttaceae bacterium]|nr:30S ribosomal protein S4 [Thermoguttaceae bacterium]
MARTLGPVCKRCRREGVKLFLKGARCESDKCPFARAGESRRDGRSAVLPPGMHGAKRGKMTEYGEQLREKQKVKTFYGVLEAQFRKYYQMAERSKGNTGQVLMSLLERRLDNVVYRLGFGVSRAQARQLISHGHICVNGRRLDVASYLVRPGDVVSVKVYKREGNKAKKPGSLAIVNEAISGMNGRAVPDFLVRNDGDVPSGAVLRNPVYDDVSLPVNPQLIVELCSK